MHPLQLPNVYLDRASEWLIACLLYNGNIDKRWESFPIPILLRCIKNIVQFLDRISWVEVTSQLAKASWDSVDND